MRYFMMCTGITAVNRNYGGIVLSRALTLIVIIVDDISIISMVFDRMRYIDYDCSVNLSYGLIFEKSNMVARGGVRRYLKWNQNLNIITA